MKRITIFAVIACLVAVACKKEAKEPQIVICWDECMYSPIYNEYLFRQDTVTCLIYRSGPGKSIPHYFNTQNLEYKLPTGVTHEIFLSEAKFIQTLYSCGSDSTGTNN